MNPDFRYDGPLPGGGYALELRLELRGWYGPLRRRRIRRAWGAGDLRRVAALLLRNAAALDVAAWDAPFLRDVVPMLVVQAGLTVP